MVKILIGLIIAFAILNVILMIVHRIKQGKIKKWYGKNVDSKSN